MLISHKSWMDYVGMLRTCSDMAESDMAAYLAGHDAETSEDRKAAVDYAYALVQKYGEGAAELSCRMYDAVAAGAGKGIPEAEPHVPDYGDVAKATYGAFKTPNPHYEVPSAVNRQVKLAAVDTTMKNAIRDGAEWAWIPQGDTCAFCLTLAANGWQPASRAALKGDHAEHIHKHCDCTYCIRFDSETTVEGYDPEKYRKLYDEADGDSSKEKINSLRREMRRGGSEDSIRTVLQDGNKTGTITASVKPDFYVGSNKKALAGYYSDWIGDNRMNELLGAVKSEAVRGYIKSDYRKSSFIGDGSTAAIRRFEIATGLNCGRNGNSHRQKVKDLITQIHRCIKLDLPESDRQILEEHLDWLKEVDL